MTGPLGFARTDLLKASLARFTQAAQLEGFSADFAGVSDGFDGLQRRVAELYALLRDTNGAASNGSAPGTPWHALPHGTPLFASICQHLYVSMMLGPHSHATRLVTHRPQSQVVSQP